jgi:hypothetical protein
MKKNKLLAYAALVCMFFGSFSATAQCFTPLYSSGNLVSDPECTALTTYAGWGNRTVITDPAKVFCGTSCIGVTNACGGSIDYPLTGKLTANTTYRLKAMVYSNKEVFLNLNGCGINGTTATYQKMVNTGSTWQAVDFIFVTGTLGASQDFWFNSCSGGNRATDMRLDNFEIYPYTAPVITTSTSSIVFEGSTSASFTVTGTNQSAPVTLTAPAGITLSTYSIPANPSAVSVNVTYDGTTSVADTIRLTSGTATAKVAVKSISTSCFTPLYSSGNIISNPYCNSFTGFGGWGSRSVETSYVYCGYNIKVAGKCGGSLDFDLTGKIQGNKTYRVKAMVSTNGTGEAKIGVSGATATVILKPVSTTAGEWLPVDFTFTTDATVTSPNMFFNSCETQTATEGYIDNWEMYEVPSISTLVNSISSVQSQHIYVAGDKFIADLKLSKASKVQFMVYNVQGSLISQTATKELSEGNFTETINAPHSQGVYVVKTIVDGKFNVTKIIK